MGKRILIIGAFAAFLCSAAYASFLDGNANQVIGQTDYTHNGINLTNGTGLVDPYSVAIDTVNNRVFVADADNHRVLWWNGISGFSNGQAASGVLGQADLFSADVNRGNANPTQNSMNRPMAIAVDGLGRVWVADYDNKRVVRYTPPLSNGMNADLVLGQANYNTSGAGYDAHSFGDPSGIAISTTGASVWVCDAVNSRVLRFDAPFSNGMDATIVVGQTGMYSTGYSCTQSSFHYPWGISVDRLNRLWVADYNNNRVLRFSSPFSTGMDADLVLGKSDYVSNTGGTSQSQMHYPYAVFVDTSNNVFVAEGNDIGYLSNSIAGSNRIVHFSVPLSSGMNADMVIGQPDYNSSSPNQGGTVPDSDTLYFPMGGAVDPQGKLWVADTFNHRVICYPTPLSNGMSANLVFGQVSFAHASPNMVKANGLYYPMGITVDSANDRVFVADTNNRVLWWDSMASYNHGDPAAGALGQPDLTSGEIDRGGSPAQNSLDWPADVAVDHTGKVWVVDYYNHRLLRYTPPLVTGMNADRVIGQSNFSGYNPGTGPTSLYYPFDVAIDSSNNVWVADLLNHRILRFNGASISNGMSADMVIGQTDLSSANSGTSPTQLTRPSGMCFDAKGNLFVADRNNARILRFPAPLYTGMAADLVLGQSDFYSGGSGLSATALSSRPVKVQVDSLGNVWVADRLNNRVVRFEVPLSSGMAADLVLGQADFISGAENRNVAVSANTLDNPFDVALDVNDNLWVDDYFNSRVVRFDSFKITSLSPATGSPGTVTALITVIGRSIGAGTTIKLSRAGSSDIAGSNVSILDASHLTCQFDLTGAPLGFWNTVIQSGGVTSTLENGFEVKSGINIYSITPSSGFNNVSENVSITGAGFLAGTIVTLTKTSESTIVASSVTVVSNAQITCRFNLNGAATGYWNVVVSSNALNDTLSNGFQILPMSTYSVAPSSGLNNGTKNVTVTGAGFVAGSTVKLDMAGQSNINATNITVVSDTQITCRFNLAGAATGFWNLTVSTNSVNAILINGFKVFMTEVYSVAPSSGLNNGTKNVTITGANFVSGSTVSLAKAGQSTISATNIAIVSDTQITCRFDLSSAATGFWNLTVSSNSASATLSNAFEIFATQVFSVLPSSGLNNGTKDVTITGANFVTGSTVNLAKTGQSNINATNVTVVNTTQITCRFNLAGAATGFWNLTVSTNSVNAILTNGFKVLMTEIYSVAPSSGLNNGTKNVTVTGAGFLTGSTVNLAKAGQSTISATNIAVVSDTQVTCRFDLSNTATGFWNLTVSSNSASATLSDAFEIFTTQVYSVLPSSGLNNGTKDVTVTGANFVTGSTVNLAKTGQSNINATNLTVVNDTQITCRFNLTGAATGFWNLTVSTNSVNAILTNGFKVFMAEIYSVASSSGLNNGTKNVTITGANFVSGSAVNLAKTGQTNINATNISVVSDTQITCRFDLSNAATGFWNLTISSNSASATLSNAFEIFTTQVFSVLSSSGLNNGTKDVTVTGANFVSGATVNLAKAGQSSINATNIAVVSDTQITCRFNLAGAATGFWNLTVSTNSAASTLSNAFEVYAIRVYAVDPSSGFNNSSKNLSVAGDGFLSGMTVTLAKASQSTITASNISVVSASALTCRVNLTGAATGYWNVVVSSGTATSTLANGFLIDAMQVFSVLPSSGINNASKDVAITGAGFLSGATVVLSKPMQTSITASSITVVSASAITCHFDLTKAATGFWNVVVTTGNISAMVSGGFEVVSAASNSQSIISTADSTVIFNDEDYTVVLTIPALAFSQDVIMTISKKSTTYGTGSQGLTAANMMFELSNDKNLQPLKDITATITYHDNVVTGVDKGKLALFYYDDASAQWIGLPSEATAAEKKIVTQIHHLSIFRVFQRVPVNDLSSVVVYPNPFRPNSPGAYNGDTALGKGIVFSGLTANCRIRIFTIAGELVRELTGSGTDSTLLWDTLNDNGEKVASGVYLYYLTDRQSDSKKAKGKLVIIR